MSRFKVSWFVSLLLLVLLLFSACNQARSQVTPTPVPSQVPPQPAVIDIILATTTSTQDSGLLDVLIPAFEQQTGFKVKTVAVGSGQALTMGQEGNADVLLVHSPAAEKTFMDNGFGAGRFLVMHNDFIIAGPATDPAGIKVSTSAQESFKKIAAAQAIFVSRGDDSGTNKKELELWKLAGVTPQGVWYLESGQGMGATLMIASEKDAYTLTDRATYLANKDKLGMEILFEGDAALLNIYHVITVNPARWPKVNIEGANAFTQYLVSQAGQELIGEFGKEKYGQQLFTPDAGKDEATLAK